MSVTFAEKLARMPHYEPGTTLEDATAHAETADAIKLASNESPHGPHPKVVETIAEAAAGVNRYPDPDARVLRGRIADRYETEPARIAISNGSCEILLAAALALCEPGDEIVYAWPSFSIYPHMTALSGARDVSVPLDAGDVHDLDAMLEEITAATQIAVICNPNNPTGTHLPAARIGAFLDRVPDHVTVILDEAYIEYQASEDPDTTLDLVRDRPNVALLRTFSKCYGLAGLRVGYAIGTPQFRAAVDAVRQPFSVNAVAQAAAAEAILHQDDVADRVERNVIQRVFVEEGIRELGLMTPDSGANFSWVELGEHDEDEVIESLARAGVAVRAGTPLGDPGHFRVSYGTRAENQRFLAALRDAIA
ncbi:MAG TPA: histidinol-phosphate transaminase [Solirubrobacterales bacterium]|jgi:histidinol-phosphate aminotransferase|nr:histidinol-phosphate transaminase [Solirubrobacterales bacterium]